MAYQALSLEILNRKAAKIIPKIDETLYSEQALRKKTCP